MYAQDVLEELDEVIKGLEKEAKENDDVGEPYEAGIGVGLHMSIDKIREMMTLIENQIV